jgi:hypothetical protein
VPERAAPRAQLGDYLARLLAAIHDPVDAWERHVFGALTWCPFVFDVDLLRDVLAPASRTPGRRCRTDARGEREGRSHHAGAPRCARTIPASSHASVSLSSLVTRVAAPSESTTSQPTTNIPP